MGWAAGLAACVGCAAGGAVVGAGACALGEVHAASSAAEPPPARKRNCRLLVTVIERLPRELVLMLLARRLADDIRTAESMRDERGWRARLPWAVIDGGGGSVRPA